MAHSSQVQQTRPLMLLSHAHAAHRQTLLIKISLMAHTQKKITTLDSELGTHKGPQQVKMLFVVDGKPHCVGSQLLKRCGSFWSPALLLGSMTD